MKSTSSTARAERTTDRFQRAFWATKRAIAEATGEAFARQGVHAGQQFVLRCLWEEDGLTPGDIARRLELATPTITKATARMETAGLLVRRPHESDRRLVRIYLTPRGAALRGEIDRAVTRLTERALASLSASDRDKLVRMLEKIRENLS